MPASDDGASNQSGSSGHKRSGAEDDKSTGDPEDPFAWDDWFGYDSDDSSDAKGKKEFNPPIRW